MEGHVFYRKASKTSHGKKVMQMFTVPKELHATLQEGIVYEIRYKPAFQPKKQDNTQTERKPQAIEKERSKNAG